MIRLAIFLLLLATAVQAQVTQPDDHGGSVLLYIAQIDAAQGPKVLTGTCRSACTMWLGYEGACIRLPFGAGFHAMQPGPVNIPEITRWVQRQYENHLPPPLRRWYRAHAANRDELVWLSGRQLIERGWARECPRTGE